MDRKLKLKLITGLLLLTALVASFLAPAVFAQDPFEVDRYGEFASEDGSQRQEFYKAPVNTLDAGNNWVPHVFTEEADYYQVQAARASIRFFDDYSVVWNENFSSVLIYDDRWTVEYQNKQGSWIEADLYNITRSYETIGDDELRIFRTGNTDIGQRQEVYTFRAGEPCKIEIRQTCDEAQVVRFVWKLNGIVALYQVAEYTEGAKQKGLAYYSFGDNFVARLQWFDELEIADTIDVATDTHAQGRKATITFGTFSVAAGETVVLDPLYEYYNTGDDGDYLVYGIRWYAQSFTPSIEHTITSVKIKAYRGGSPGTITVSIRATSGGEPTGGDLCSGTTNGNTLTSSSPGEWREITLGAGYLLSASTKYAIVVRVLGGDSDNKVRWRNDYQGTYAGGDAYQSLDSGSSWEANAGGGGADMDLLFEDWGEPSVSAPTVTTQAASSVEETTATGNGNITDTGGENCDYRGFDYDIDSGAPYTYSATDTGSFGTGAFTKGLTSLSPGTTYYYRAKAHNSAGWGYGSELTFYTKPEAPTGLGDTGRTNTSISLSWTKGTGSEKTMIRYRTDQYPTGTSDGTQAYFDTGNSTSVGSLSAGQIYYFRAWAWDTNSGYSDNTSDDIAYTLPGDPSNLVATAVSDTQIDLSWSKGTGSDKTMIRREEGSWPTGPGDGEEAYFDTGTAHNDTGRTPNTQYFYRAWAYDSDSSYYSDSYSQDSATTYGPPTVITNSATNVKEATATIGGNISQTNGANATNRGLEWDTDSGSPYANDWNEDGDFGTGPYTHNLTLLTQGELYYFRAYATNTYGTGYGSEDTFLTKPIGPNTLVATPSTGEIDLTWVKGTGAQKTYIRGKDGSYPADRTDGYLVYFDTGTNCTDSGLTGGHTYYYKAWSYATEGGKEHYSDNYDFTYGSPPTGLNLWFQPNDMISGTTLPDRGEGAAQNGTITWGSLPTGITTTVGSLKIVNLQNISKEKEEGAYLELFPEVPPEWEGMYSGEQYDVLPGSEAISELAAAGQIPIKLFWVPVIFGIAIFAGLFIYGKTYNIMAVAIAGGIVIGLFCAIGMLVWWVIIPYSIMSVALCVSEKTYGF